MTTKSQSTVGTVVYLADRTVSPPVIIAVPALKGFSNIGGGKAKKVDKSNFDSKGVNESQPGRSDPGEGSGEIVYIKALPGHQKLKKLYEAGCSGLIDHVDIYVGDGDGTAPPTLVGVGKVLTPPKVGSPGATWARSGTIGTGYISTFAPKKADDDIDRADFAIQWTGTALTQVKGEAIANQY